MADHDEIRTLPLVEETTTFGKVEAVTGRVRVRTLTRQHEQLVQQDLLQETVEVIHVPMGHEITIVPQIRQEGDVTIIPVIEEILVVEKRLVLREEIHLRRSRSTEPTQTSVILRKQEAVIERLSADDAQPLERKTP